MSELKHIGFVPEYASKTAETAGPYYEEMKKRAGPLKSPVENVEKKVLEVGIPYYEKYVPLILEAVDGQVDYVFELYEKLAAYASGSVGAASAKFSEVKASLAGKIPVDVKTFANAREAYKEKLAAALSSLKEKGEKLPTTILGYMTEHYDASMEVVMAYIAKLKEVPSTLYPFLESKYEMIKESELAAPYIAKATEIYVSKVQPYVESSMEKAEPYIAYMTKSKKTE